MRIVSLEDDEIFGKQMKAALQTEFPGAHVDCIRTESHFYERMEGFEAEPPDVFIIDVMVKWADASEQMPVAPPEIKQEGYYRAGLRCRKRLLDHPATAAVPVILFTFLERADIERVTNGLPERTMHVRKDEFATLVRGIRNLIE